jgi:hypothetical protein
VFTTLSLDYINNVITMNNGGGVVSEFTVNYCISVLSIIKSRTDSDENNEEVRVEE